MYVCTRHLHTYVCDRICENPPNILLFQNEIEARKADAIITVVNKNKIKMLKIINHHCFLNIVVKFKRLKKGKCIAQRQLTSSYSTSNVLM